MGALKIIVLAKQVPDTRNISKEAMKADGTVNRGALPAIFNPDDLNALEQALTIKDDNKGSTVTIVTMGPGRAAELIREAMYRGADGGYLITDRLFAGADTLATSYTLSLALKKIAPFDLILCGRQAIDGDTAQVGPQVAQKIGVPQVTYAEEILSISKKEITVRRRLERGIEVVSSPLPALVTVHGSAKACRSMNAKLVMKYKHARTITEIQNVSEDYIKMQKSRPYLNINEWSAADLEADQSKLGLPGSPTKVKKVDKVIFKAKESKVMNDEDQDIENLIKELLENHTIG